MSAMNDLRAKVAAAIARDALPVSASVNKATYRQMIEALRRQDDERRNFSLLSIGGVPHVWDTWRREITPIRLGSYLYEDPVRRIRVKVRIVVDDTVNDDVVRLAFSAKKIPAWTHRDCTVDGETGVEIPEEVLHPEMPGRSHKTILDRDVPDA